MLKKFFEREKWPVEGDFVKYAKGGTIMSKSNKMENLSSLQGVTFSTDLDLGIMPAPCPRCRNTKIEVIKTKSGKYNCKCSRCVLYGKPDVNINQAKMNWNADAMVAKNKVRRR